MRFIYTLLLALAAPFLLFGLYKKKPGKPDIGRRWREHFGFVPSLDVTSPLWFHAVSVGEVIAAKPVLLALRAERPDIPIVVTTTTTTGAELAEKLGSGISHRYMPIDFGFAVRRFINIIKPRAMVIMETELWPNTLSEVKKAGVPVTVINARLSERSKVRYQKIKPIFRLLSSNIDHIACQFDEDADRFSQLELRNDQLSVTGSVKFDLPEFDHRSPTANELKAMITHRPTWIAASTHPGEDGILLEAHKQILQHQPDALMILVPRHPERFSDVAEQVREKALTVVCRSKKEPITAATQVYLGDTMGEMMTLFSVSDIAFMAGSLIGDKVGGHNLLEPASLAKPLLTGPSFYNFQVIGDQLIESGACQVTPVDAEHIARSLIALFNDSDDRQHRGQQALAIVNRNRGAVANTLKVLKPYL
ncbi:lipid IV(A) 3-deoxy-D-manno-octulosonic acid transferase [Veronia pacifica]|uniref:3-deoxy-D-manno-octulosonic acid transferase n=1 Tax=Veronia pacifica TaxID=1080227 RepID=A0A1C3EGR7_9GAMM|nr:lipid IV(A) 3-deoxy-D-manno-octulosonic acid transferase [Veronia pacifica]ODA32413.1 3-deoxy-D-manno-octulosonic acid transferase [Veronia pacifica]